VVNKNLLPTYRQQAKPIQPLRPLTPAPRQVQSPTGQRTMPLPGAPLLPPNPFLNIMRLMLAYRK
jgi:hypothetical protein